MVSLGTLARLSSGISVLYSLRRNTPPALNLSSSYHNAILIYILECSGVQLFSNFHDTVWFEQSPAIME